MHFDARDSMGETPLCTALRLARFSTAQLLLRGRASADAVSPQDGLNLLHYFLERGDERASLFLLDGGAEIHRPAPSGESPLVLAVRRNLPNVLEALCRRGANMEENNAGPGRQPCPLWLALQSGNEDLASVLVRLIHFPNLIFYKF